VNLRLFPSDQFLPGFCIPSRPGTTSLAILQAAVLHTSFPLCPRSLSPSPDPKAGSFLRRSDLHARGFPIRETTPADTLDGGCAGGWREAPAGGVASRTRRITIQEDRSPECCATHAKWPPSANVNPNVLRRAEQGWNTNCVFTNRVTGFANGGDNDSSPRSHDNSNTATTNMRDAGIETEHSLPSRARTMGELAARCQGPSVRVSGLLYCGSLRRPV
jgi:hypothetical protein